MDTRDPARGPVNAAPAVRRRARGLGRDVILEACLRLAGGPEADALSFRKIGRELGADPTALYRHFADKDELLLALADRVIGKGMEGYRPSPRWDESLRDLMLRTRAGFLRYPQVAALAALRVTRQEGELKFIEAMLRALEEAGFERSEAVLVYRACGDFMLAWTGFSAGLALLGEKSAQDDAAWVRSYARVPERDYPLAVSSVAMLAAVQDEDNHRFALDLLLAGIAARLEHRVISRDGGVPGENPEARPRGNAAAEG
ncbi:TetR/AcrR family transcriptional regulator C-terminal domain-containing protein [Paeniglutamicibacter sp. ABSL32-1]|uniref:TetR/AcrR family transcriptional regulator n=1 Tax=Paeniglutamicibacter quisquiliarum TaxID=2849498 RepID=UPI001C2CEA95|nr:TetR/AcrR family transcriptional regulator C-terminal domain-containing protein [Paeniglutamicibacter quisquiliarum]MBV1780546.1 TetR/AcrR family transcriptional regulator C-terminal domain-containing protein [Paeniglutamicibacter quisquiliarum]